MIGLLRGQLIEKRPNQVLVEVGGVGYQIQIPLSTFAGLGALHSEIALLIHTHLREDQIALYGFITAREKQCFELLISASGVGPSLALKILSGMGIQELVPAIRKSDLAQLVRIPGVGRKTAERIVVELRDKLAAVDVPDSGKPATGSQLESDVASALENLGYDSRAVEKAIQRARGESPADFETLLRSALQVLGGAAMKKMAAPVARIESAVSIQSGHSFEEHLAYEKRKHSKWRAWQKRRAGAQCGLWRRVGEYLTQMRDERNRIISGKAHAEDARIDASVRPTQLADYIGQNRVKENLQIAVDAAKSRNESLDHVLLYGPPGLGKTTLAQILAREMGSAIKISSGPLLEKKGDLTAVLTSLDRSDFFFLDEIHRLQPALEEILYPAMEDFRVDLIIGQGPGARVHPYQLNRFTLIGATTRAGLLMAPLRSRFGIVHRLEFYSPEDLRRIVRRSARILDIRMDEDGGAEIARRSRGTPRVANRLLRRVRDYADVRAKGEITLSVARDALAMLGVDEHGLDEVDRNLMLTIIQKYSGGPVGLNTIAASLSEEEDAIEEIYEPYLMQLGLLDRTPRGRVATALAFKHFGISEPRRQSGLFS